MKGEREKWRQTLQNKRRKKKSFFNIDISELKEFFSESASYSRMAKEKVKVEEIQHSVKKNWKFKKM